MKSWKECLENIGTVVLDASEEKVYRALADSGHLDGDMLTLAGPGDGKGRPIEWFRERWHRVCREYALRYDEPVQWHMVLNRGSSGKGQVSAHVTWVNKKPRHVGWLMRRWCELYGTDRAKESSHPNCLRYAAKNMAQPDARTYSGAHNRRASPKRGKGFWARAEKKAKEKRV